MQRPNVLYIHSHDTGRYVQPYGFAVPTPNIQALAEEGVTFTQAFSCAPVCSPSRAALLTGQIPHSCGMFGLVNRGFELRDRHKHIANVLSEAGYLTVSLGVHHVVRDPLTCGYKKRLTVDLHHDGTNNVANAAVEFLGSPPERPFFLSVGFRNTHVPFPEVDEKEARYCAPPAPLPDTPETRKDMAGFNASARILDQGIGEVLSAFERNGLAENTLVICTTDHGIAFPAMKCNLTDHGIGVMLILRGPGGLRGGSVSDALVSQIDLFPTICDLAGIASPDWLQGKSLLPLVGGQAKEINDEIFAESNFHAAYEPLRAVRTSRWKYIRRYTEHHHPIMAQIDACPSKDFMFEHGYSKRVLEAEELYDLVFDPNEARNLLHDAAYSSVLDEMRSRLENWMKRTDDPLLTGPIPVPETAVLSDIEDYAHADVWKRRPKPWT